MAGKMMLQWPTESDQGVANPYDSSAGTIRFHAPPGTGVLAAIGGEVTVVAEDALHITSPQMVVTYTGLQNICVQSGQAVNSGDTIAQSGPQGHITLAAYQSFDPTGLFIQPPKSADTTPTEDTDEKPAFTIHRPVFLTPTIDGLRVREAPVDGKPIGTLKLDEVVTSLESNDDTLRKLGVQDEWLKIRREDGTEAFTAAWLLRKTNAVPDVRVLETRGSLLGMNLDINHAQGRPDPVSMQGIGWVRVKFNVSYNPENDSYGNKDIDAAYQRYLPYLERYARAGIKVLMVFTHQLYGEGAGFNWEAMDSGRWRELTTPYADFARQSAARFAEKKLVHAYQIWNEQDTNPKHARAAVPVPARDYAHLLAETIRAIRSVDSKTPIITGGHTSGPQAGSQYARDTFNAMPVDARPDGIAFHPYGRGVKGHRFSNFGALSEEIEHYSAVLPGKPLWITEWGVLDHQGRDDVIPDVTSYAQGFMNIVREEYPGQVAACIWYAWADGMDNGFGLVDINGRPKAGFSKKWRKLG